MARPDEETPIPLAVSPDRVCFLIVKLRQFHAKTRSPVADRADNFTDDAAREVLFIDDEDTTEIEIRDFFVDTNVDEAVALQALLLVGMGAYDADEWPAALEAAAGDETGRGADTVLATPLAADYLEEALIALGHSCADVAADRL